MRPKLVTWIILAVITFFVLPFLLLPQVMAGILGIGAGIGISILIWFGLELLFPRMNRANN